MGQGNHRRHPAAPQIETQQARIALPRAEPDARRQHSLWRLVALVTVIIGAAAAGAAAGAVITNRQPENPASSGVAPSAETIHAQDVRLCTTYAIANSAMPNPDTAAMDVLPGANAIRSALLSNPVASIDIRRAMTDVVNVLDSLMAAYGHVRTSAGWAQPPQYMKADAQAAYDRAWRVCGLNRK